MPFSALKRFDYISNNSCRIDYAAIKIFKSIPLSPSNAFSSLYDASDSPDPEIIATESSQLNVFHEHESQLIALVKLLHGSKSSLNRKNKNFVIDCSAEVFFVISKYHSINIKCISIDECQNQLEENYVSKKKVILCDYLNVLKCNRLILKF